MGREIVLLQIMTVIGGHQGDAHFLRQTDQLFVLALLIGNPMNLVRQLRSLFGGKGRLDFLRDKHSMVQAK